MDSSFFLDQFTINLLEVYKQLVIKRAMPRKGVFAKGLGISLAAFNKIESHTRNFPIAKRDQAITYLNDYFGISKKWWDDNSIKMFEWEPAVRRFSPSKVQHNFITLKQVDALSRNLERCNTENEALKEELARVNAELSRLSEQISTGKK